MKTLLRRPAVALCFLLGSSLFASLPPTFTPKELAQGYSDSTVLARPLDPAADTSLEVTEQSEGMAVRHRYHRFGNLRVLRPRAGETIPATIKRLRATGRYAYVEPDIIIHARATPNDPSFNQQWGLNNTGASSGTAGADIRAVSAWDTLNDASSVIVAIIDSGARLSHSDLAANLWSSTDSGHVGTHGISVIGGNGSITNYNPNDTEVGHGTHVSGIIGAVGNNGIGTAGVAWKVQLMELRYLHGTDGTGSMSDSLTCIQFAIDHGAKVINASYGHSGALNAELEAIKKARDAGIIFVAAAGNDAADTDLVSDYPAAYALDNIVAVAATTRTDTLASFSNYGPGTVEIAAPGAEIYSTWYSSDTAYVTADGTSMAAPHVSGAFALLRAKFPDDTYRQSINRLLRSATKLPALSGQIQTGARLNLAAALASTDNRPFNDDFSTAAIVSGPNLRIRSSNVGATPETSEPAHAGTAASHSLWWSWTAPDSTQVSFDTSGSAYDTTLAVYTGSAVNTLSLVAANDDATGVTTSRIVMDVAAGTTYYIAVDGKSGATGYTALKIGAVPANDNFAGAKTLSGNSVRETATTLNATRESGETLAVTNAAGHSVWYRWTAPATTHYSLAVFATTSDTVAAVYTGSSLSSLTKVASNDNNSGSANTDALVPFDATAGTTYYLQVDHAADTIGSDGGDFILTLTDSLWEYPASDEITASPAVASDGTIYFAAGAGGDSAYDTNIYAVTAAGVKKWSYATSTSSYGVLLGGPAVGSDGTVYCGSYEGKLYALRSTGALRFSYTTDSAIYATPAIASDGTVYVRNNTKLYALTAAGALKWTVTLNSSTDGGTYSSPVIAADGTLYVGTNGALFAFTDTGTAATTKWTYPISGDIYTTPALAADGTIYFATIPPTSGSASGVLYALTPGTSSATVKWSSPLPAFTSAIDSQHNGASSSPAIGADGTVYFAAYDHKLYALDPATGATRWTCALGDETRASSPVIGSDGTIYVGNYDGSLYAITSGGQIARTYATALKIRSSPVIAGNRLYVGGTDAKLHAFDIGQTNLASPWPMFHQNALRTGRAGTGAITITTQPASQTVLRGATLTLTAAATSTDSLTYQWYKDGVAISGATSATYTLSAFGTRSAGSYTVVVTGAAGSVTSAAAVVTLDPASPPPAGFANISTRAYCGTGNNVTIGGLVISGSAAKRVLIRAVGPTLGTLGIPAAEVLADPVIEIHQQVSGADTILTTNDDWTANLNAAEITSTAKTLGATALAASDTKSAAILTSFTPGAYTVQVRGNNSTTGIVLVEIYDADSTATGSIFANLSTRADAVTNNGVAIGGFVISGNVAKTVLIRAVGPTLGTLGVPSTEVLADPTIELHHYVNGADSTITTDDDWSGNSNAVAITTLGQALGATALASSDTKSSALLVSLAPGAYTVITKGTASTTGIVLLEIYDAD